MEKVKWWLALVGSALLVAGCALLDRAKAYNRSYDAKLQLVALEQQLRQAEPTGQAVYSLYMYDEAGTATASIHSLLAQLTPRKARVQVAFWSGDVLLLQRVMGVPITHTDTLLLANMHLINGNYYEAERLAGGEHHVQAMLHALRGDTERATPLLHNILRDKKEPRPTRLRAGRALLQATKAPSQELLLEVASLAENEWERFALRTQAGQRSYRNEREQAVVLYLQAVEGQGSAQQAATLLLAQEPSAGRNKALHKLLPLLVEAELYPLALRTYDALQEAGLQAPHFAPLALHRHEVELVERYQQAPTDNATTIGVRHRPEGGFRQLWGNVPNADNWALRFAPYTSLPQEQAKPRPSTEEYQQAKQLLHQLLHPSAM